MVSRRRVFAVGALSAAGLGGAAFGIGQLFSRKPAAGTDDAVRHLHITAHPDDDLYFFNPDLLQDVVDGTHILGICLTTGEADGKNFPAGNPLIKEQPVRFTDYAAARQNGLRAAYARMAVGDAGSPWKRVATTTRTGAPVEVATLVAAPRIRLMFLNLWNDGANDPDFGRGNVRALWSGTQPQAPTMQPTGSPVPGGFVHTRQSLVDTLVELVTDFDPHCIRLMDPDPDFQVHDATHPRNADSGNFSDNGDHTAAALFSWAAVQEYWRRGHDGVADSYRGYYNQRWPQNLRKDAYDQKLEVLATYGGGDGRPCTDPVGCGDLKLGNRAASREYGWSTTHRYGTSVSWLHPAGDGALHAFAVHGGRLVRWAEKAPGAQSWQAGEVIGGADLLPYVTVGRNRAGGLQAFGIRMIPAGDPQQQVRELGTFAQPAPGAAFGAWEGLGNPHEAERDPTRRRRIGMPVVGRFGDGRLAVFVRNGGTGLSARIQDAGGTWRPWADLGGGDSQDGLSVVTVAGGLVEVYASTHTGVLRWYQERADGPWLRQPLRIPAPAAPPTVVSLADGRLVLLVREGATADVLAYVQPSPGTWDLRRPLRLGSDGGFGPVAAALAPADGRLLLAIRNNRGTVSVRPTDGSGTDGNWAKVGLAVFHSPAVAADQQGRPVVVALQRDGQPRVRRMVGGEWRSEALPPAPRQGRPRT
ncbi:PIG-L family deacetylase [Krasilnikovia sp. MM14-A1004]|uniref:PIG-L family deacetylase n=1 Tax=Krasilnikovia sp. MM14-A1004 TaxID=3373541 RepID=UPI00399D177C